MLCQTRYSLSRLRSHVSTGVAVRVQRAKRRAFTSSAPIYDAKGNHPSPQDALADTHQPMQPTHTQAHTHTGTGTDGVGVYVHWPYCSSKCTYCNFNRYVQADVQHDRMRVCLRTDLEQQLHEANYPRIRSIFFGGGTPTLAEPSTLEAVIESAEELNPWPFSGDLEVTMEGNPTSVEMERLQDFRTAGVNRISLGVQALSSPTDLSFLGRNHSVDDAIRAVEMAKTVFPGRVSFNLIFGRPNQTVDGWTQELDRAMSIADRHISLYQLTVEKGTPLQKKIARGEVVLPDEDTMADLYQTAVDVLEKHGFRQYEVSNFAQPGAECQHNLGYWRGCDYIGVGPGAHGRVTVASTGVREARIQYLQPDRWMDAVEFGSGTHQKRKLAPADRAKELIMLGMRTSEGVSALGWAKVCPDGSSLYDTFRECSLLPHLVQQGHVHLDADAIRPTTKGMGVLDSILPHLLAHLDTRLGWGEPLPSS